MGKAEHLTKPEHLAGKLVTIRKSLKLSQNGMLRQMGLSDLFIREEVSAFERGVRVPPVGVLLLYARSVGITVEMLIDDELELPSKLPATRTPEWVMPRDARNTERGKKAKVT